MCESALANNGRKIGLLRGAGTRFALFFYAMVRLLRLKAALCATVHSAKFRDLKINERAMNAVRDIQDSNFWKAIYNLFNLCRAVFPALRLLRFCDSNVPAMDKVYHLTRRTSVAISRSLDALNDKDLFPRSGSANREGLEIEAGEVFGEDGDAQDEASVEEDSDDSDGDESGDENYRDEE